MVSKERLASRAARVLLAQVAPLAALALLVLREARATLGRTAPPGARGRLELLVRRGSVAVRGLLVWLVLSVLPGLSG